MSTPMPIFKTKPVALNEIRIDGQTQARCAINQEVVSSYAVLMEDHVTLPPVVLFFDGAAYWLADGFHRFFATKTNGKTSIIADIHKGTQRDAVLYSLNANVPHGLTLTNDDKRKAVLVMLGDPEWSKLTDRAIARHCGCSHMTVGRLRNPEPASGTSATKSPAEIGTSATPVKLQSPQSTGTSATRPAVVAPEDAYSETDALNDKIQDLQAELVVSRVNSTDSQEASQASALIQELRDEIKSLRANLKAVTQSRDSLMNELAMVKRQCVSLQTKMKKAA